MKIIGRQGIGFILVASEDELHRIAGRSPWTTESSGIRFAEGHVIAVGALFDRANKLQGIVPAMEAAVAAAKGENVVTAGAIDNPAEKGTGAA